MEEKVLEELEKLKSVIHGHFERQTALLKTVARGVPLEPRGLQHALRPIPAASPEGECAKPTTAEAMQLGIRRSTQTDASASSEPMSSVMSAASEGLNSSDTFVNDFLKAFEDKAHHAAERLYQKKRSSLFTNFDEETSVRSYAKRLVRSPFFAHAVTTIIVFNLVILGIEVDVSTTLGQDDIPRWFGVCNGIVVILFTLELGISLYAQGCRTFFCGRERWWNFFDLVIILLSLFESVLDFWVESTSSASQGVSASHLRFVRTVRLARALRGIRVMRLLRYVSALRTLVLSIMSSMASLMWTLILLLLLFYSFGVLFTQLVSDECRYQEIARTQQSNSVPRCEEDFGDYYWSSISMSMLTLFMSTTGGVDWEDALDPLMKISLIAVGCLVVYITITFFAIVNVITGVFVTTAMETTAADKDLMVMKQLQRKNVQVDDLKSLFAEISGSERNVEVSIHQFKAAMSSAKFAAFLQSMGISTEDVGVLFKLLDADASGLVELDEFVTGCLNLHGTAKSLQLARMSYENKLTRREIKHMHDALRDLHLMTTMLYENWTV